MLFKRSIATTLFFSLTFTTLCAVLMLALLFRLSLGAGFSDYVAQFELTRLDKFEQTLLARYQRQANWSFLHTPEDLMPEHDKVYFPPEHPPESVPGFAPLPHRFPPPHPNDEVANFGNRLALFAADGQLLMGRREAINRPQRALTLNDGTVIGYLALAPLAMGSDQLMRDFIGHQTQTILVSSLFAIVLSALAAYGLALYFRKPIAALAKGAQALADGNLHTRIELNRNDELGHLAIDFNKMAQKLERFEQARQQWVADTSHELRTPLTILRAHTDAMRDGVMPLDQRGLERIDSAIQDLDHLVNDLYQLARADVGIHDFDRDDVNLKELFYEINDKFAETMRQACLQVECAVESPLMVAGDYARLNQLFSNLVSNSIRYTQQGGLIRLTARRENNNIRIALDDSLPGVPDAALPLLFDRFYRVDSSHSRRHGGSGLGLSICKSIVEGHKGTIEANHSPLGGLQIVIVFPAQTLRDEK